MQGIEVLLYLVLPVSGMTTLLLGESDPGPVFSNEQSF